MDNLKSIWRTAGRIALWIVLCLFIVYGAFTWASGFMESLFAFRSPLKDSPPTAGLPLGGAISQRVVVVLVDALRLDTSLDPQTMPYLQELRGQAAVARMQSRPPSYSEPGYTVILTGAWPDLSDGPPINLPYEEIPVFTQDDIFSAAKRAELVTAVSGYYWFEKLIPQTAVERSFYTPREDQAADREVVDAAQPWLEQPAPGLTLIHIDQVDYAGHHEGGPRDPHWNLAAKRADDLLREIAVKLDFSQDSLLVISDHGQIERGGHGGNEAVTLLEPFVLIGAGVVPGDYGDVNMVDVAPTLAVLLGTNLPASSQGSPQLQMLALPTGRVEQIDAAVRVQQSGLLAAYRAAMDESGLDGAETSEQPLAAIDALKNSRLLRERLFRLIPALLAALLPAALLFRWRGRDWGWYLVGAGLTLAVFHVRYALIEGRTYSLSSLNSAEDLYAQVAGGMALGLLVGWLVLAASLKLPRLRPGLVFEKTLWLVLVTVYMLFLPALWSYVLNGLRVTWTLPDFSSAFIGFLSLLQMIFLIAVGLLLACAAALATWAVGKRKM